MTIDRAKLLAELDEVTEACVYNAVDGYMILRLISLCRRSAMALREDTAPAQLIVADSLERVAHGIRQAVEAQRNA